MNYSFDSLYDFVENNVGVTRWLCSFKNENNDSKSVKIDIYHDTQCTVKIIEEESDNLTDDERGYFYYLLDKWIMNHLI